MASSNGQTQSDDQTFTVLLFASASTYAGGVETLHFRGPTTLAEIFVTLETKFPGFTDKILKSSAVTVDLEYVEFEIDDGKQREDTISGQGLDRTVQPGSELAIIPPVSSG